MRIKIEALDTLFFRDGKPFTMGAETWGIGIFPPYPSVVYGALRSAYFSCQINRLKDAKTVNDPTRGLKIKNFYLQQNTNAFYPLPLDCVKEKGVKGKNKKVYILRPIELQSISNCPVKQLLRPIDEKKVENIQDSWIDDDSLLSYLNCKEDGISYIELKDIVVSEPKIGIGRNKLTHTAEDSMLYRVAMKRLKDTALVVDFEGMNLPKSGLMKLAVEGRPVHFEDIGNLEIKAPEINANIFKLYLSTPAIFKKGWLPEWIDEETLAGEHEGLKLKLIASSIGRVVYIGGFDINAGEPKPMRRAVPAGSVYYFKILNKDQNVLPIDVFHGKAISDVDKEQGFGITYVGAIQ